MKGHASGDRQRKQKGQREEKELRTEREGERESRERVFIKRNINIEAKN